MPDTGFWQAFYKNGSKRAVESDTDKAEAS